MCATKVVYGMLDYGTCSKIWRQTGQNQIRLLLKKVVLVCWIMVYALKFRDKYQTASEEAV